MLLAGRTGGPGLCGGRGRGFSGSSESEARISLYGCGDRAACRPRSFADSLPIRFRTSMGLLLRAESPQNGDRHIAPFGRAHLTLM